MNTLLPIIINGHSFTCDENQMWNLNDIYRTLDLSDSKRPSEWNNQVRTQLDRSGNFRTVNGDGGGTWATEKGTIAYAMWVSTDFYSLVIDAFVFMRNDAIMRERIAILQADEANAELSIAAPKADIFDGRLERGGSVPWSWACKSLGLAPQILKEGLLGSGKFIKVRNRDDGIETIKPPKVAFSDGYFVAKEVMGKSQWQVTARGYAWMQAHAQRWRGLIEERSKAKAKEYRQKRKAL
ncbi:KilA-N domain-containing protein [Pectobacterium sp. CHL-2024]|uniref:KilA-N domain-containing protein n=1 Tax=Pectobacterium sp. CHL-2024 TaxID=3377079 RepID=UPI0038265F52